MASSYSTDLKLELMVTGENAGTWGDNTNNNLNLIQQAIAGYEAIALTDGGTVTLAMTDKTISNARNMVIKFTGTLTGASTVTIPDSIERFHIFDYGQKCKRVYPHLYHRQKPRVSLSTFLSLTKEQLNLHTSLVTATSIKEFAYMFIMNKNAREQK